MEVVSAGIMTELRWMAVRAAPQWEYPGPLNFHMPGVLNVMSYVFYHNFKRGGVDRHGGISAIPACSKGRGQCSLQSKF